MARRPKKFERTNEGLRDALMSEMEDIREGISSPLEAQAFAQLAGRIIESLEVDLKKEREIQDREYRERLLKYKQQQDRRVAMIGAPIEIDTDDDDARAN